MIKLPLFSILQKQSKILNKILRGQAVIEYILLLATVVLIFNSIFSFARVAVLNLWKCELIPKIQVACPECTDGSKNDNPTFPCTEKNK